MKRKLRQVTIFCGFVGSVQLGCGGRVMDLANGEQSSGSTAGVATSGPLSAGPPAEWQPGASGGTAPSARIIDGAARIGGLTVYEGRLYWLSDGVSAEGECLPNRQLSSCDPNDCVATLRVIAPELNEAPGISLVPLRIANGSVYYPGSILSVVSCALEDCSRLKRLYERAQVQDYLVTTEQAYILSDVLVSCDLHDCEGTLERIRLSPPAGTRGMRFQAQLALDDEFLYVAELDRVLRTRRGTTNGTLEVLYEARGRVKDLALYGEYLYLIDRTADGKGKLLSCPKTGCGGVPQLLADDLTGPRDLLVDEEFVYFMEQHCAGEGDCEGVPAGRDRVVRCSRADGSAPTVLLENVGAGLWLNSRCPYARVHMAMDATRLYVPTCDPELKPRERDAYETFPISRGCGITAVAK